MAKSQNDGGERVVELLEKMLVLQMHSMGATQDRWSSEIVGQFAVEDRISGEAHAWVSRPL